MAFNILETTIDQVHAAYRSGELTCRQLVQMYLDRIAAYDKQGPAINAIITLNSRGARRSRPSRRRSTKLPVRWGRCTAFRSS